MYLVRKIKGILYLLNRLIFSMEDTKSKLTLQRKEYELIAKRQLTFIDKIIVEKQDLSEKYEELSRKSKSMEISHSDKVKVLIF